MNGTNCDPVIQKTKFTSPLGHCSIHLVTVHPHHLTSLEGTCYVDCHILQVGTVHIQ